jgi:hypothetical protein
MEFRTNPCFLPTSNISEFLSAPPSSSNPEYDRIIDEKSAAREFDDALPADVSGNENL